MNKKIAAAAVAIVGVIGAGSMASAQTPPEPSADVIQEVTRDAVVALKGYLDTVAMPSGWQYMGWVGCDMEWETEFQVEQYGERIHGYCWSRFVYDPDNDPSTQNSELYLFQAGVEALPNQGLTFHGFELYAFETDVNAIPEFNVSTEGVVSQVPAAQTTTK